MKSTLKEKKNNDIRWHSKNLSETNNTVEENKKVICGEIQQQQEKKIKQINVQSQKVAFLFFDNICCSIFRQISYVSHDYITAKKVEVQDRTNIFPLIFKCWLREHTNRFFFLNLFL